MVDRRAIIFVVKTRDVLKAVAEQLRDGKPPGEVAAQCEMAAAQLEAILAPLQSEDAK